MGFYRATAINTEIGRTFIIKPALVCGGVMLAATLLTGNPLPLALVKASGTAFGTGVILRATAIFYGILGGLFYIQEPIEAHFKAEHERIRLEGQVVMLGDQGLIGGSEGPGPGGIIMEYLG